LQNAPFCSISASGSNFNPRNTQCIPVVKIIAFLELKQKLTFFKGLESYPIGSGLALLKLSISDSRNAGQALPKEPGGTLEK
jgi:hypothetical protein